MRVLLIDDETDILEQAKIFLEKEDNRLDVETAGSAEEGLEMLNSSEYDAVVSDYQMPRMDGLEFLESVRKERDSDIPFIIFTGKGREEVAIKALNLGADRYLQKGGSPKSQYRVLADAVVQEVDHHRTELERERARKEWRRTFDALPDIATLISPSHEIVKINKRGAEALGMDREDIIGKKCYELVHGRDEPIEECPCTEVDETGEVDVGEVFEEKGRYYIAAASPMLDENGEVEAFAHTVRDITERKEMEEELRESEERFRSIFEGLDVAVFVVLSGEQNYGKILEVNPAAEKLLGYSRGVLVGRNILDFVSEEEEKITGTLGDGERKHFVQKKVRNDGTEIWTEVSLVPFEYGGRETHLSIQRDITERKEAEKELRKLEREKSLILESTDEIIAYHDTDHNLIWANQAYSEATGESVEEMKGRKCYEIWLGRKESCEGCPVDKALETGESERGEMSPPGEEKDWLVRGSPVRDEEGNIIGAIETTLDITERKEKQKKLDFKTGLLDDLMDNIPDIIYFKDEDARFVEVNQSKAEEVGEENRESLYGKTDFDYYPEERAEKSYKDDMRVIEEEKPVIQREERHETPEGEDYWLEATKVPRYDDEGNITGLLGISRDITERKKMEEELQKSERKFRRSFEANPDPVFLLDRDGVFVDVNQTALQVLGFEKGEIVGSSLWDAPFFPDETMKKTTERFERRKEGEEIPPYSVELETKDGERIITEVNVGKFEENGFEGEIVIARDITERKMAEERFETFFEELGDAVFVTKLDEEENGEILEVNPAAVEETGYSKEELIGMDIHDLIVGTEAEKNTRHKERLENGETVTYSNKKRRKDGSEYWDEVTITPINYGGEKAALGINHNITKRKKEKEKYKTLFNQLTDALFLESTDGRILDVNKAACELLGYDYEELMGMSVDDLVPENAPAFLPREIDKATRKGKPLETVNRRKDGTLVPIELRGRIIELEEEKRMLVSIRDITERKEAEEREEFLHSLLRHDVRNKAQVVEGYLELLRETNLSEEQEELVEKAIRGSEDGIDIIEKVRSLREISEKEKIEEINVGKIIKNVISERESQASEKGISIEYEGCECKVRGGPLLEELFSNLIENSIVHSNCEKIFISSEETEDECIITVEDNGCGIPDEIKEKIFERGFKGGDTGVSGLGMYLVKQIIESYDGGIEVKDSELGGARFDIRLKKA
ncbi:hypothetical protein AKJ36_02300 [candidate division MSBL1 archaeon SCGC-AAA259I07]|uniref:histidine kinase n=1 Tax=candidate division MSBL1 archaeon SCGC-AAA259I07 TaxID=1698266 RepID=A0A133UKN7_9EURY|nr:hypothetical protein AKJ36_02300 [candidate division MSBL1 archaeon SCGC-AAA259I07]